MYCFFFKGEGKVLCIINSFFGFNRRLCNGICILIFIFFFKNFVLEIDECKLYMIFDEKDCVVGYSGNIDKCDEIEIVILVWYCFFGDVGDKLVDFCVLILYCGMYVFGWLKGNFFVNEGEIVERKVCFYFGFWCCKWFVKIKVKKCKGFFVYEF